MSRIVLDTNSLIQSIPPKSKFHKIWKSFLDGTNELCVSSEILVEYDAKGIADFLLGEGEAMKNLAYSEFFADLRDLLTQEQLDTLEDKLLYVDMAVIRQLEQMALTQEYPEDFAFPDPKNPQDMEEPVPVLVDVTGHETLKPLFGDDAVLLAVAQNGGHRAAVKAFAEYLATEKE